MSSRASISVSGASAAGASAPASYISRFHQVISDRHARAASITTTTTATGAPTLSHRSVHHGDLFPLVQLVDRQLVRRAVLLGVLLRRERHPLHPARTR